MVITDFHAVRNKDGTYAVEIKRKGDPKLVTDGKYAQFTEGVEDTVTLEECEIVKFEVKADLPDENDKLQTLKLIFYTQSLDEDVNLIPLSD